MKILGKWGATGNFILLHAPPSSQVIRCSRILYNKRGRTQGQLQHLSRTVATGWCVACLQNIVLIEYKTCITPTSSEDLFTVMKSSCLPITALLHQSAHVSLRCAATSEPVGLHTYTQQHLLVFHHAREQQCCQECCRAAAGHGGELRPGWSRQRQ